MWNGTYELIPNSAMFRLYGWSFVLSQNSLIRLVAPKKKKTIDNLKAINECTFILVLFTPF